MYATLTISLPCAHTGGDLVIRHGGRKFTLEEWNPEFTFNYSCFYADCKHEVKPLKSGYRVALVYNVFNRKAIGMSEDKERATPSALKVFDLHQVVVEPLVQWLSEEDPDPMIYILSHKYTEDNGSLDDLKGKDAAIYEALREASEHLAFSINLSLIDYQRDSTQGGYGDSYTDIQGEKFEVRALDTLHEFDEPEGLEMDHIMQGSEWFDENSASESDIDDPGPMGNYAPIKTRVYHPAALVIFPTPEREGEITPFPKRPVPVPSKKRPANQPPPDQPASKKKSS
jgi:hypothetical protein